MIRLELVGGTSSKFWSAEIVGKKLVVRFGRIGSNGQEQSKSFPSASAAQIALDKAVAEKMNKGYLGAAPAKAAKAAKAAKPAKPAKGAKATTKPKAVAKPVGPGEGSKPATPSNVVGSYYWATGPLVLGSPSLRATVQDKRDAAAMKALRKARGALTEISVAGEDALVFYGNFPSTWHALGKNAGVLVRMAGHGNPKALTIDPWAVPASAWKLGAAKLSLSGPARRVLFDSIAGGKMPVQGDDARTLEVSLPAGDYEVDRATFGEPPFQVTLQRVRPAGKVPTPPAGHVAAAPPSPPADVTLQKSTAKIAKRLVFVSTDGGPVLACPVELLASWHGVYDAAGTYIYDKEPCDYDRACAERGYVLDVGAGQAMVLDRQSVAFVQLPDDTAYFLFWDGADDGAHVLEAVLSIPDKDWKKHANRFTIASKQLGLIDSAKAGRDAPAAKHPVKPGTYTIETCEGFRGKVIDAGAPHDTMANGLRLRIV